jgi:hypothetical protein
LASAARYLDIAVLAIALPVFVIADLPLAGYAAIAAVWIAQSVIQRIALSRAFSAGTRANAVALMTGSIIARLFLVTVTILLVGSLVNDDAGLAAGVLAVVLVTAHLAGEAIAGALSPKGQAR